MACSRRRPRAGRFEHTRRTALSIAFLFFAVSGATSVAAGDSDVLAGARLLRARSSEATALATAPSSTITGDVGALAIIEHDGTEYAAETDPGDGSRVPNYAPRASVAQTFYQTHGDFYDFLVVFTNFEFDTTVGGETAVAFHNFVRNDVQGIGLPVADNGDLFGSPGRLRGYVDMAAIARYTTDPRAVRPHVALSATPGTEGFRDTLNVLAHEIGHQWLAHVRFKDAAGGTSSALLGLDGSHWSYLLDSDASLMYGADWVARGDGTYVASRVLDGYSALDLYLMGFLDRSKAPALTLLHNPSLDPTQLVVAGDVISAEARTIKIGQIEDVEGPRSPSSLTSPKAFRVGFIFLTSPGVTPTVEDLEAVERIRQAFAAHFFALTRGVAVADTSLAAEALGPETPAPDLDRALAWLVAQQAQDGHWEDASTTVVRDTAATLEALAASGTAAAFAERGRVWLSAEAPASLDFLARRASGLGLWSPSPSERSTLVQAILEQQNADGGFGPGPGYASDPLDTALALHALAQLKRPADTAVRHALSRLAALRTESGGWPAVPDNSEVSTVATAHVLLALEDWVALPEAASQIPGGLAALLARRNPDLGFGESPSTPYATALALQVLVNAGASAEILDGAVGWLQSHQLGDGSWDGSVYATALALVAIKGGAAPNLVVPPDSVVLTPPTASEGDTVRVTARVLNAGKRDAGPSVAQLFDGDPAMTAAVAQAAVPALGPAESAEVVFDLDTTERAGTRTLYVVADAGRQVAEAREDDNATSRVLVVKGLLADLVLQPGDLTVTPYPPEDGETVQIAVSVANAGERRSVPCTLRVVRGNPRQGGVPIGQMVVPAIEPGSRLTLTMAWDTTGQQGDHVLYAVADATYVVAESNELNNEVGLPVRVTGPQAGVVDLDVAQVAVVPDQLLTLPQTVEVRAVVRNLGREQATAIVGLFEDDAASGPSLATQPIDLGGRSSSVLVFPLDIASSGDRAYVVMADSDNALAEADETNNVGQALLRDPQNIYDVEIRSDEVVPSKSDLVVGDVLNVAAIVRNRGTAPVADLPVILGHVVPGGVAELARQTVTIEPGASLPVNLQWKTAIEGEAVALVVRGDPFNAFAELSETNNEAALAVRVQPSSLTNLSISGADISSDPDPPLEGQSALVSALVRNTSAVDAGEFAVRFYRGDPDAGGASIAETTVPTLAASASATVSVTWPAVDVRGVQGLFVVVDALSQVEEYDETDNRAFRPFSISGLPDLVLTTADVVLTPAFPRAGEQVNVRATVRNLGQQPSAACVVRAYEGPGSPGTPIGGDVAVPALAPGELATAEITWLPASPEGERTLSVLADPPPDAEHAYGAVREQDEGNNLARRTVVVQDADLYLTAPYFSPNGDGVQDETTLAYRATSEVEIVVSDSRGRSVRTLAERAPASGSVAWDGRSDAGQLMWDGTYTLTLEGGGGAVLGRKHVVLDTNRSSLLEGAGTGLLAAQSLLDMTCDLPRCTTCNNSAPRYWEGPVWMPDGQEALVIITHAWEGFVPGLIRIDRLGSYSYIAQGNWWTDAGWVGDWWSGDVWSLERANAVSPDGRFALVGQGDGTYLANTTTGEVRELNVPDGDFEWSPDGRWLVQQVQGEEVTRVFAIDGSGTV